MRKKLRDTKTDPAALANRVILQKYGKQIYEDQWAKEHSEIELIKILKEFEYRMRAINAAIILRLSVINEMMEDTQEDWSLFFRTKDRWMANVVMGLDNT